MAIGRYHHSFKLTMQQMARRMKFSVIGLPHYTIWHLYEPSVDDIRHMEEMEHDRQKREKEEAEKQARLKNVKDEFTEPNAQWEKDKGELQDRIKKEDEKAKQVNPKGDEAGPNAPPPQKETEATRDQEAAKEAGKDSIIEKPKDKANDAKAEQDTAKDATSKVSGPTTKAESEKESSDIKKSTGKGS